MKTSWHQFEQTQIYIIIFLHSKRPFSMGADIFVVKMHMYVDDSKLMT